MWQESQPNGKAVAGHSAQGVEVGALFDTFCLPWFPPLHLRGDVAAGLWLPPCLHICAQPLQSTGRALDG